MFNLSLVKKTLFSEYEGSISPSITNQSCKWEKKRYFVSNFHFDQLWSHQHYKVSHAIYLLHQAPHFQFISFSWIRRFIRTCTNRACVWHWARFLEISPLFFSLFEKPKELSLLLNVRITSNQRSSLLTVYIISITITNFSIHQFALDLRLEQRSSIPDMHLHFRPCLPCRCRETTLLHAPTLP